MRELRSSKRSSQSRRKASQDLLHDPDFPAPIPLPVEPKPTIDFADPSALRYVPTARDGLTVMMPAVQPFRAANSMLTQVLSPIQAARSVENLTATQILPSVSEVPPSARHVDPRAWHGRTHVEDNDLEPETRGRHALNELMAADAETGMPDLVGHNEPAPAVRGAYGRIVAALAAPRPESLADAVRIARQAYKTGRDNRRWFAEEESKLDACWRRIAKFNADWDEHLREWNAALCGQEAVDAGYSLAATYEENRQRIAEENARRLLAGKAPLDATPTSFTRGMVAELQQLIVQRATAGSAVAA